MHLPQWRVVSGDVHFGRRVPRAKVQLRADKEVGTWAKISADGC